ncbi:hypothetical protein K1719_022104 [Acacia pycnantha]|nr:hypothetical protein K1719_022104 [Acacia pycnantha]
MRRSSSCPGEVEGLIRGAWTAQEDKLLTSYITLRGEGKWSHVPIRAGLNRSGKSCRLRWLNYLRPDIKRGNITQDEEDLIIRLHKLLGNRWSLIAGRIPGRTDNEIKNYWNTTLGRKLRTQSGATTPSQQHASSTKSSQSDDITRPLQVDVHEYVNLSGPERNDEFHGELNGIDFFTEFNVDNSMAMAMNAQADEFSPIDELIGNCGTADGFRNIGSMDLDLVTFMLD